MVLGRGARLTVMGLIAGLTGAAALTRYLEGFLFGLTPLEPRVFVLVSLLFMAIAALALWIPARRATSIDPMLVLRDE